MSATGLAAGVYPPTEAGALVKAALAGGVNWFDTAEGYGGSEQALSTALHASGAQPGEVVIATKWLPMGQLRACDAARNLATAKWEAPSSMRSPHLHRPGLG